MIDADSSAAVVEAERKRLRAKWQKLCGGVVTSVAKAGDELFTFPAFPCLRRRALRTTKVLERIDEGFRCRSRAQASLPNESVLVLPRFGLFRRGQTRLRKLDGCTELRECKTAGVGQAA